MGVPAVGPVINFSYDHSDISQNTAENATMEITDHGKVVGRLAIDTQDHTATLTDLTRTIDVPQEDHWYHHIPFFGSGTPEPKKVNPSTTFSFLSQNIDRSNGMTEDLRALYPPSKTDIKVESLAADDSPEAYRVKLGDATIDIKGVGYTYSTDSPYRKEYPSEITAEVTGTSDDGGKYKASLHGDMTALPGMEEIDDQGHYKNSGKISANVDGKESGITDASEPDHRWFLQKWFD